jgi:hypothetical protein
MKNWKRACTVLAILGVSVPAACSSSKGGGTATCGGALLANPSVTQTCQSCLGGATGNDCAAQAKNCTGDSNCASLNACVNKCANLNEGCIQNCSNAASSNATSEWNAWWTCGCNDCSTQCDLCGGGGSSSGGSGSSSGSTAVTCQVDTTLSCTSSTGYYCTGADNPQQDGLSTSCSNAVADANGGFDYCCT